MPQSLRAKAVNDLDRHIGEKIREQRIQLGLTQQALADLLNLTYQQIHKYERGENRVSASRLIEMAAMMGVSVMYFFDPAVTAAAAAPQRRDRLTLSVMQAFARITEPVLQEAAAALVRTIAEAEQHFRRQQQQKKD